MADAYYTLIVIPEGRGPSRKIRVSARLARGLLRGTIGAVLLAGGLLVHYAWLNGQVAELEALRSENATLQERSQRYAESLDQLQARLAALQRTVTKLGVMSGLEQVLPEDGGLGGVTGLESSPPSRDPELALTSMSHSLSDLAERSSEIESFYQDQKALLDRTPSVWPVRGYLSSGFGNRIDPFTGRKDFHPGIDVSAPRGTKIAAPAAGVVVAVGRRGAYGNAVIIDHGYGVITRYGHLDGFNVRAGQRIERGDVIGFVGSSGRSNAPHLHYEVWVNDKAQNPIHYILDEYRSFG